MPLQNRVDPFGAIHANSSRGMFTGNRGAIHDPATRTLLKRRWLTKSWIICVCEFGGRRREVMGRNTRSGNAGWTELFFLDEVTALAAGHRPCFFCRREAAKAYTDCFGKAFGMARSKVADMDIRLHAERLASGGKLVTLADAELEMLPDGAMIASDNEAWAIRGAMAHAWSFAGYDDAVAVSSIARPRKMLITPPSTVAVLLAGYKPVWHGSAGTRPCS